RARPALGGGRGAQGPAAALRRFRGSVPAHPDAQLPGPGPLSAARPGFTPRPLPLHRRLLPPQERLQPRPAAATMHDGKALPGRGGSRSYGLASRGREGRCIHESIFRSSSRRDSGQAVRRLHANVQDPLMTFAKRCLFAVFALLLPFAAAAQQQGLEIDIIGGNASALPIAVVPMPYQGSGSPPPTDVAAVVRADLERSGQFRTLPESAMVSRPTTGAQVDYPAWRALRQDF